MGENVAFTAEIHYSSSISVTVCDMVTECFGGCTVLT